MSSRPVLRLNDGFPNTSPQLREAVRELQQLLIARGFALQADGLFGAGTDAAVIELQREIGVTPDGLVGPVTWAALLGQPAGNNQVFTTTLDPNDPGMINQFLEAGIYKPFVDDVYFELGFQPAVIGGIGSRESHWGLLLQPPEPGGSGDFSGRSFPAQHRRGALPPDGHGFGRGLMQIDYDFHEFARTGKWFAAEDNIRYAGTVLRDSRRFLEQRTTLRGAALLRASIAAYNAGPATVAQAVLNGRDPDSVTTGRDYSRDVLNRAGFFQLKGWE